MSHEQLELDLVVEAEERFSVEYLTIAEAAERVRCCERTIRRAIDCGELRAGRVRGANSTRDLDEWVFSHAS
jgi:excisionase family DNA binding protein